MLLRPEQISGSTDLQVSHGQLETRPEFDEFLHRLQALAGFVGQRCPPGVQQVAVRLAVGPAHTAAQLVQLGEAHQVRIFHDDRVHARDVEPDLHDGRAHEHVGPAAEEIHHHLLEPFLGHLSVSHGHPGRRDGGADAAGGPFDGLDAVMHDVHLAAPIQFPQDRLPSGLFRLGADLRHDRQPGIGRRLHYRHVAQSYQGHVQRARDRGSRQREDVDAAAQLLELFFVLDAEALLLVDDDEAELGEPYVLLQQTMRADSDIDGPGGHPVDHAALLETAAKPAEHLHFHGIGGQPLEEHVVMLLRQDGGGDQHGHLLAVHHRLERRAQRDLGLTVAHVAGDQPVHGLGRFHIALDILDRQPLVWRLLEFERGLQLLLPRRIR